MNAKVTKLLAAIAHLLVLAACSVPGTLLRHAPADPDIAGIDSALSLERPVDVVLVHGMCFHDSAWVVAANDALAKALGMSVKRIGYPIRMGQYQGLLYEGELAGPRGTVRTFAILWSPAAAPARAKLCYDTSEPTQPPDDTCPPGPNHLADKRALLDAELKNQIMDGCLSEAMYAVGPDGIEAIGSTVEKGLEIALNGGREVPNGDKRSLQALTAQQAPLFVVTQSLGSKLFIDAAIRMANRSCDAFTSMASAIGRTVQVFMEANQLPILSLAYDPELRPLCPEGMKSLSRKQSTGLGALVTLHQAGRLAKDTVARPLKVAAFSDPNDILSYTLVPAPGLPAGLEVSDIVLVNDWAWLGLVENPMNAHTTYGGQCRVRQVIAFGTAGLTKPCPAD